MKLNLYSIVKTFLSQIDLLFVFLLLLVVMLVVTVIQIVLSRRSLSFNKHLFHLASSFGVVSIQTALSLVNGNVQTFQERFLFPLLLLGSCMVLYAITLLFHKKPQAVKSEHLDLVKFLDGVPTPTPSPVKTPIVQLENSSDYQVEKLKATQDLGKKPNLDIDFTHVKNVAERLNYYNLSVADRRIVTELLTAVAQAENGDFTNELRARINDYLGTLLKLMAKYGV